MRRDNVLLAGPKIQVIEPSLHLFAGRISDNELAVAGRKQVVLAAFKAEAVKEEDLIITNLTVANVAGFTPVNFANGFSNLALYRGGSRISEIIAEPNADSYKFADLRAGVRAGDSVDIFVKADLDLSADGTVKFFVESARAMGENSKIPAAINNRGVASPEVEITQTVLQIKSLSGGNAVKGQKENKIASFNLSNNAAEKVRLDRAIINSFGSAGNLSNNNGFSNLKFAFTDDNGRLRQAGSRLSRPVADVNEISFGGLSLDPGENLILDLFLDADKTAVGDQISLFIRDITARGQLSGVNAIVNGAPTDTVVFNVDEAD